MNSGSNLFAGLLLILLLSCSSTELIPDQYGIQGTWRLYEEGGSPGFGYYVTPIPATPLQHLTFTDKGELRREGERLNNGLFQSPYYRVDSTKAAFVIVFLATRKDTTGYRAGLTIKGDTLRIAPTCYEGCHFGLVRIH